jgi:hypothetical protein
VLQRRKAKRKPYAWPKWRSEIRNESIAAVNFWIGSDRGCVDDFWVVSDSIFINNLYVCNESIVLSVTNQFSLLNCVVCNESIFASELYCLQRINVRYQIIVPAAKQFSLPSCGVPTNQFVENFVFQQTSSLTSLCCSKPICWQVCASANQFADEFVL